jgi:CxxC motif-containing protein
LEYGISICLLSRSYITIKNEAKAIVNIKSYLEEKMHFLECMKEIGYVRKFMEKGPVRNGELLHQELGN